MGIAPVELKIYADVDVGYLLNTTLFKVKTS